MNFNDFLNNKLSEAEESSSVGQVISKKSLGYSKMYNILLNNEKFEGEINTPEEFRAVIDAILNKKIAVPASLKKNAKIIDNIIKKIEAGKSISKEEEEMSDDFADDVEDFLFSETYMKRYTAQSSGGSGGQANKARFSSSIPVKYTTDGGKTYYGLITPPTGFISWQNKEVHRIVKNDPELVMPQRLKLIKDGGTLDKDKLFKDLIKNGRFVVDDKKEAKAKVQSFFEKHGASVNEKGELPGIEKVVKKIEFWKDIATIF